MRSETIKGGEFQADWVKTVGDVGDFINREDKRYEWRVNVK